MLPPRANLSKIMGTSTTMIGDVYGHLLPDSEEYLRGLLDNYDAPQRGVSPRGTTP